MEVRPCIALCGARTTWKGRRCNSCHHFLTGGGPGRSVDFSGYGGGAGNVETGYRDQPGTGDLKRPAAAGPICGAVQDTLSALCSHSLGPQAMMSTAT